MQSVFESYFELGWEHMMSWGAWDHLLFIMALVAIYTFRDWKQVLILVTAFTFGHSITLVLSTFNVVRFKSDWVEFLIPCTIAITAVANVFIKKFKPENIRLNYYLALGFGLVHGMGFANGLRSLLGKEEKLFMQLLGFNLGLEAAQIGTVLVLLTIAAILFGAFKVNRREYVLFISGGAFFAALLMALDRIP